MTVSDNQITTSSYCVQKYENSTNTQLTKLYEIYGGDNRIRNFLRNLSEVNFFGVLSRTNVDDKYKASCEKLYETMNSIP